MAKDVRTRMVRSAATLFRERGIAGTSLADIVEHSQAPRGSIYHHFPGGKNQLAEEATVWAGDVITRMIGKASDPPALVRTLIGFWRAELSQDYQTSCPIMVAVLGEAESADAFRAAGKAFTDWEMAIADALRSRGVTEQRADSVATLLITAVEGAVVLARAQRDTQALDRVEGELIRLIGHLLVDAT